MYWPLKIVAREGQQSGNALGWLDQEFASYIEDRRAHPRDDFVTDLGRANPYGVYDLAANAGWVSVGTDHDTAAFAVESIRRWWNAAGSSDYPLARRLLITADAGGSNGHRTRAWKTELAALAAETGLEITVCHFPPGTQCRCLSAAN